MRLLAFGPRSTPLASAPAADGGAARRLAVLVAGCALVWALAAWRLPLVPDEAYYWLWSRFPGWGYYDHPPMVAWGIAAGTRLFGDGSFGVRAITLLGSLLTLIATWSAGRVLFGPGPSAFRGALWLAAAPLIGVGAILATPDVPSVLFWSLAMLALALVLRSGRGAWWLAVGAASGLGVISKYTDLFLGVGIVLWLILDGRQRHWLRSPWTWAGGLLAGLIILPVVVWNAEHHWASLALQFGRLPVARFKPANVLDFLGSQALLLNPLVTLFVILGFLAWARGRDAPARDAVLLLLALSVPLLAYMLVHAFQERVKPNWLAPVFPPLALLAAAAAAERGSGWRRLAAIAAPIGLFAAAAAFVILALPAGSVPFLGPQLPSASWTQLAFDLDRFRNEAGAAWIATTKYETQGELAYALRNRTPVAEVTERKRYAFMPAPAQALPGGAALLVLPGGTDPKTVAACFGALSFLKSVQRDYARHRAQRFDLYKGIDPRPTLSDTCGG